MFVSIYARDCLAERKLCFCVIAIRPIAWAGTQNADESIYSCDVHVLSKESYLTTQGHRWWLFVYILIVKKIIVLSVVT